MKGINNIRTFIKKTKEKGHERIHFIGSIGRTRSELIKLQYPSESNNNSGGEMQSGNDSQKAERILFTSVAVSVLIAECRVIKTEK
jgi:hypothetical protein